MVLLPVHFLCVQSIRVSSLIKKRGVLTPKKMFQHEGSRRGERICAALERNMFTHTRRCDQINHMNLQLKIYLSVISDYYYFLKFLLLSVSKILLSPFVFYLPLPAPIVTLLLIPPSLLPFGTAVTPIAAKRGAALLG